MEPKGANPVIRGFHADPEILYSTKTKRYYIYATTDGYEGWGGWYFKVFSSKNLKKWKDEGVMLDLRRDVSWSNNNAWAPCMIERDGKYYFYYTAEQQIGVAVSDSPVSGFKDLGHSLVGKALPQGEIHGQNIDPDVFCDPVSGKYYLYWGNCYLALVELNDDMVSIKEGSFKLITPKDGTFREGAYMIYRDGKYYMMWSEDDTRSENYGVRYGIMSSPTSEIEIPENNRILYKNPSVGIYATGHNSVICAPGSDDWYMVYHRFKRGDEKKLGESAGFHREICIDRLFFDDKGLIIPVVPTIEGVK